MFSTHDPAAARATSRSRLMRQLGVATLLGAVTFIAACSSDSATGPGKPVPGAYPMTTARGLAVPHTFTDAAGSKLTIEGGSLTLGADGTFALSYKGKLNALTFDITDEGTFSQAGSIVRFTPDDGDPAYTGRVQGASLVVDDFKIAGAKFDLGFTK